MKKRKKNLLADPISEHTYLRLIHFINNARIIMIMKMNTYTHTRLTFHYNILICQEFWGKIN